ncbi:MAG: PTS sugar transporter subunit IIC [Clostridiales bacterium]|nr:PTS sugar transporter subunit IIC [Clostridiales bacterium]
MAIKSKNGGILGGIYKRYLIDAMGAMAFGLFSTLIIGIILSQLSRLPGFSFLLPVTKSLALTSPVVGSAIAVAIAWEFDANALVIFACAGCGATGYLAGGPVGAFIAGVVGAELGQLVSKRTPLDIVITPLITIVSGGLASNFAGPYISRFITFIGSLVNVATDLSPILMGIIVSVIIGMALTLPISSAALCIMLNLNGLAAGAATVGCCAQMVGFAVASYRENGFSGLLSQGLGTSMLQMPNIMRRPQIWIAPTLAAAVLGPISTAVFHMKNIAAGAGMGTSGLVGQVTTYAAMIGGSTPGVLLPKIILLHFVAPALLTLLFDRVMRKGGLVRSGDMKINQL